MKILVLSDSHGAMRYMEAAVEREKPTHVIHLGDHDRDAEALGRLYPMLPIMMIRGNCDFDYDKREEILTEYDGVRILACHGHRYGVKYGLLRYALAAKEKQANVALFGHTHQMFCGEYEGVQLFNPGSCHYGTNVSYGVIEIRNQKAFCRLETFSD